MHIIFNSIRRFFATMGLVEQSQMVASTAVVVAMATIVTGHFITGRPIAWMDFMSIITVGSIGYMSVFFSLKYGRILEQQRRELLELNTISEAVNHSVELDIVLQNALEKVMELTQADCGWIYLNENEMLVLKHKSGTRAPFFAPDVRGADEALIWFRRPSILQVDDSGVFPYLSEECRRENIRRIASIPLVRQGAFAGVLIIGGADPKTFQSKKSALLHAFGNQISLALNNASLYEQVRQSERLYADLYENSPDMYHSVNRDGVVVGCNTTESVLLGLAKNQIIGRPLADLYPERQRPAVQQNLRKIFELGQELKGFEEQVQRSDGSLIDVSVNTSTVVDAHGRPVIARMVLRDITEKKRMEAKILQAQKIDSIGNLAGGIAHDFNNILTAILGSASIMRRRIKEDQRWLKYVELIETTSRRGAAVTRQLLTFARKSNPHVQALDLNTIIDQTVRLFEATTPRTIHIKCTLSPEPVIVDGDEGQLQQALLNLCINARDAMPNGGVLVINCRPIVLDEEHARQQTVGAAGEYVMVTVADSGAGIPPEIVNQIWEPFFTTKEQGKGTGLGLSVVYGVIRGHHGHINVNSEVDSGTIFTIYLPKSKNVRSARGAQPNVAVLPRGTERVLLIEDEISVGEVGEDILQELGYTIEVAHTGREAVQKLSTATPPFDLIILDMNMPRMGGQATFERIKEMFPRMRVLVCSGYSATMLDDGRFTKSIDGFLQKPYELEEIAQKIRQILDRGREAVSQDAAPPAIPGPP